jgi:uncharacterized protein (DUF302 family)
MKRSVTFLLAAWALTAFAPAGAEEPSPATLPLLDMAQTIVKQPLARDVSMEDAVEAMKIRANKLNFKLVAEMPLSKQVAAMGEQSRRIDIFQFCDPLTAKRMVEHDISFAAYLPCRIALVEDAKGQAWLMMMNLDMFIHSPRFDPKLKADAVRIRDMLLEIMDAGATGDW